MNRTVQDMKMEVEAIKQTQSEWFLEMENIGKWTGKTDAGINNRIQETEERISDGEDTIEDIDTTVKENTKCNKLLSQNIQEIQDTMKRPNLRIIGIDGSEESQVKGPTIL